MAKHKNPKTLYLTRNGLLEPLGQSQVISYLRDLSKYYEITLITYEKADDWSNTDFVNRMKTECERLRINWLPQRFHSQPKLIAPALSMLRMVYLVAKSVRQENTCLIHARSYIPAAVALIVNRIIGIPFIFDMRALWPEELITANRLRRGSWLHKVIVFFERACLKYASGVVTLTHSARFYLQKIFQKELTGQTVVVIPTCADLDRFVPARQHPSQPVIGCLGTVLSGWFRLDWLAAFFAVAAKRDSLLRFVLTTRDDPAQLLAALDIGIELKSRLSIAPSPSERVQEILQGQMASVMFYAGGEISELGRSPTRMAEILGCGLPVVANEGIGDVAQIIREHRVGVLVSGPSESEMNVAWDELQQLLNDPDLAVRCRRAAEECFSLEAGTAAYLRLYKQILSKSKGNEVVTA